jgi:uncharacterized membrane protein (Fun14 family)
MITESITPLLTTVGFGGMVGFLIAIALRYVMKILAVIAGIFFAALAYLHTWVRSVPEDVLTKVIESWKALQIV